MTDGYDGGMVWNRRRNRRPPTAARWGAALPLLIALGLAGAGARRRLFRKAPAAAPRVWLPAEAEPSADGSGLVVAVNVASGNGDCPTDDLRSAFPAAEIVEVDPEGGADLRKTIDKRADDAIAIGISGGDGSINTAAQVALDEEKPLAVFPSGTFNHLSQALAIGSIEDSARAVKEGQAVGIDVATIDGKVFLNTASFGGYVEFVEAREKLERRIGKWPAMLVALVRVMRSYKPIDVEIDGRPARIWMAFIGNCRYEPEGFAPSRRERFDDQLLDLRYIDGTSPWSRLRLVFAVLTGRLGETSVYHQECVERLVIRSSERLGLARDGEVFDASSEEVIVEKLPKRLAVYVPHEQRSA